MNLKGIYKEKTEGQKLFFFVLIIFISSIVGFLSSAIITTDTDILRSDLTNPDNIFLIKLMQLNSIPLRAKRCCIVGVKLAARLISQYIKFCRGNGINFA